MRYRKINIELVAFADEADAVVAELNAAIDRLEGAYTIFGGEIETAAVEKSGTPRKSALMHAVAAGGTAVAAVKLAGDKISGACRKVF
jgi:3-phosphoglycerate kinase